MGVRISSVGKYLPKRIMSNLELSSIVDTSDEWIQTRTGIKQRHIASKDESTSLLAIKASENALEKSNLSGEDIELIIVATMMPDSPFPATACKVQNLLNAKNAAAFDMSAACTGFIYSIEIAAQFIKTGFYKNALVVGSEVFSRFIDWEDRTTCVLFGDGAGAVLLEKSENDTFLGSVLHSDGSGKELLYMPAGGTEKPTSYETINNRDHYLKMDGLALMQTIVPLVCDSVIEVCQKAKLTLNDIDYIVPHQANINIINEVSEILDIPKQKFMTNLEMVGNTSSASIPICITDSIEKGFIKKGNTIMMVGFGAGLTYGASIIKWDI
jgi:3-oxoacyl-[acyl-carrier-protein] synthase-3